MDGTRVTGVMCAIQALSTLYLAYRQIDTQCCKFWGFIS